MMHVFSIRCASLVALSLGLSLGGTGCQWQADSVVVNPAIAIRDSLRRSPVSFVAESTLVAFVDRIVRQWTGDLETQAELELLRLQSIDRVAQLPEVNGFNPYHALAGVPDPPAGLRGWTEAYADEIVFSEPGAAWFVPSDVYWRLHDRYRATQATDEIGRAAMKAGFAGECEGYAACYLGSLLGMSGRYLEEHPGGQYRMEALEAIQTTLDAIDDLNAQTPLCGQEPDTQGVEMEQLNRLRTALDRVALLDPEAPQSALDALRRLEARCRR